MPQRSRRGPREGVDLDAFTLHRPATVRQREDCWSAFGFFCTAVLETEVETIRLSGILLAYSLKAYGQHLFSTGAPSGVFAETINAAVDRNEHWKAFLGPAWSLLGKWEAREPSQRRNIMSEVVLKAFVTVGLLWGWDFTVAATLLGFCCMLHPGEFLDATRRCLILPSDLLSDLQICYLRIVAPKTSRFVRRQHAQCSDKAVVAFCCLLYGDLPPGAPLFAGSRSVFRRRWDAILQVLGLKGKLTPGCLRGSGATFFWKQTEDIPRVAWRGRWQRQQTLEFYLQEVAGQQLLLRLSADHRDLIKFLASLSDFCLDCRMRGSHLHL